MSLLKIVNPATGEPIKELVEDTPVRIQEKCFLARAAQPAWAALPLSDRLTIVGKLGALLARDKETLASTLSQEMGKPITQARNEVQGTGPRIDFFLAHVAAAMEPRTVLDDVGSRMRERIELEPLGIVAHISPWNYPLFVGSSTIIPALLTGNAVIYKPSEYATLTGMKLAALLHEAGVPGDIFPTVIGGGKVGAELLNQDIDAVFFTGSYGTGKKVAEAAASRLLKVQLELGGKDPIYVCDDASLDKAAGIADGAFYNTGQSCCAVERVYVHGKIYESFVASFNETVKSFVVGNPADEKTYIGPLAREAQLAVLENQVKDAVKKGARLLCGGKRVPGKGYYFEPTVLADCNHSMDIMREESFGPVIGLQKVSGDDEAVKLMNDTPYGLTAGVYTPDASRARTILSKVSAGSVYWNCCDRVSPRLPWSGRRHSGLGCTLSTLGIQAFLQPKAWHLKGAP